MKLFVVGESSPDPEKWSIWSEWSLVIAADEDQAKEMAGAGGASQDVCEIPMDKPLYIVKMSEPNHGDDI